MATRDSGMYVGPDGPDGPLPYPCHDHNSMATLPYHPHTHALFYHGPKLVDCPSATGPRRVQQTLFNCFSCFLLDGKGKKFGGSKWCGGGWKLLLWWGKLVPIKRCRHPPAAQKIVQVTPCNPENGTTIFISLTKLKY